MEVTTEVDQQLLEETRKEVEKEIEDNYQFKKDSDSSLKRLLARDLTEDEIKVLDQGIYEANKLRDRISLISNYLNNFICNFPKDAYRNMAERGGYLEEKHRDDPNHSPIFVSQTRKQFFDTVDKVIAEELKAQGLTEQDLEEMKRKAHNPPDDARVFIYEFPKDEVKYVEFVLSVYIRLRAMGYKEGELVG